MEMRRLLKALVALCLGLSLTLGTFAGVLFAEPGSEPPVVEETEPLGEVQDVGSEGEPPLDGGSAPDSESDPGEVGDPQVQQGPNGSELGLMLLSQSATGDEPTQPVYNVTTGQFFATVQEAIDAVHNATVTTETTYTIEIAGGVYSEGPINIKQQQYKNIVLKPAAGASVTFTGLAKVQIDGMGRWDGAESVTIKDITFDFSSATGDVNCIADFQVEPGHHIYAHNIIADGCQFIGTGQSSAKVVGVSTPSSGGHAGITLTNCTAINTYALFSGYSSNLTVNECHVETTLGSGINEQSGGNLTVRNSHFEVTKYGIRSGSGQVAPAAGKTITVDNCFIKSSGDAETDESVIVLRGGAPAKVKVSRSALINPDHPVILYNFAGETFADQFELDFAGNYWESTASTEAGQPVAGMLKNLTLERVKYDPWYSDAARTTLVSAREVLNANKMTSYATIQEAIDDAAPGDTIVVLAGTYEENLTINKGLVLMGAQAGISPTTAMPPTENQTILKGTVTLDAGTVTVDGFTFFDDQVGRNFIALYLKGTGNYTVQNCVFVRNTGKSNDELADEAGYLIRGIHVGPASCSATIANNLFTGSAENVYRNSSWRSAIWSDGISGSGTLQITGNVFTVNRAAINLDNRVDNVTLQSNGFWNNGTHISYGGSPVLDGEHAVSGNRFGYAGTVFNLSGVAPTFRLDATANTYCATDTDGTGEFKAPSAMTLEELFGLESLMYHKGKAGRQGFVEVLPGTVFVTPDGGSIQAAIDVAQDEDIIEVAEGTYAETLNVTKPLTIKGAGIGKTIVAPSALLDTNIGHKYDPDMQVAVLVNGADGVHLQDMTIDAGNLAANAVVFWNASKGSLDRVEVLRTGWVLSGVQTGQGIAVDAGSGQTTLLSINYCHISGFNKNAIDAVNGNGAGTGRGDITVDVKGGTIVGTPNDKIAQNGILFWERAGGSVGGSVDGVSISGFTYTKAHGPEDAPCAVLLYGVTNSNNVSITNTVFAGSERYVSLAAGTTADVEMAGCVFDGKSPESDLTALAAIEDKIDHKMDEATLGKVYIKPNTLVVTPSNRGIQAAIDIAEPGDTIEVTAAEYVVDQILIAKGLTLKGAGAGESIIDGGAAELNAPGTIRVANTAAPVVIDGFTIRNAGAKSGVIAGICARGLSAPLTVQNCRFIGRNNGNMEDMGIWVYSTNSGGRVIIQNNKLEQMWQGILLEVPRGGATVQDNLFERLCPANPEMVEEYESEGVFAFTYEYGGKANDIDALLAINGNRFTGFSGVPIAIGGGYKNSGPSVFKNVEIKDNVIEAVGTAGTRPHAGIQLRNYGTDAANGDLAGVRKAVISGNRITGTGSANTYGIWIGGDHRDITITGNSISGFPEGIAVVEQVVGAGFASEIKINSNSFTQNTVAINNGSADKLDATYNYWGTGWTSPVFLMQGDVDFTPWYVSATMIPQNLSNYVAPSGGGGAPTTPTQPPVVAGAVSQPVESSTGGTVALEDESAKVEVPPGAVEEDVTVTISLVSEVEQPTTGMIMIGNRVYEITAETEDGEQVTQFQQPLTLTFSFTEEELAEAGMSPEDLVVFYWDAKAQAWIALPTRVDPVTGTVTAVTDHFTVFALMAKPGMPALSDLKGHWSEAHVLRLVSLGVVGGYEDETFRPEAGITREEFAKMVVLAAGLEPVADPELTFADADEIQGWAKGYVAAAVEAGIITGLPDNRFGPAERVTRQQAATMIGRALGVAVGAEGAPTSFADDSEIESWARAAVNLAVEKGIITGFPDNTFRPGEDVTRAQAATMLAKLTVVRLAD